MAPWGSWLFSLVLPAAVAVCLVCVHICALTVSSIAGIPKSRRRTPVLKGVLAKLRKYPLSIRSWSWSVSTFQLVVAYASVIYVYAVRASLDVFRCRVVVDTWVLASDPGVPCSGSVYDVRVVAGMGAALGYGVGIPLLLSAVLLFHRSAIDADQVLRLQGVDTASVVANPFFFVQHKLSVLYRDTRPGCMLWCVVVLLRKAGLVVAVTLLYSRAELCRRVVVGVLMAAICVHGYVYPYVLQLPAHRRSGVVGDVLTVLNDLNMQDALSCLACLAIALAAPVGVDASTIESDLGLSLSSIEGFLLIVLLIVAAWHGLAMAVGCGMYVVSRYQARGSTKGRQAEVIHWA
jgi:hypothetical protein